MIQQFTSNEISNWSYSCSSYMYQGFYRRSAKTLMHLLKKRWRGCRKRTHIPSTVTSSLNNGHTKYLHLLIPIFNTLSILHNTENCSSGHFCVLNRTYLAWQVFGSRLCTSTDLQKAWVWAGLILVVAWFCTYLHWWPNACYESNLWG